MLFLMVIIPTCIRCNLQLRTYKVHKFDNRLRLIITKCLIGVWGSRGSNDIPRCTIFSVIENLVRDFISIKYYLPNYEPFVPTVSWLFCLEYCRIAEASFTTVFDGIKERWRAFRTSDSWATDSRASVAVPPVLECLRRVWDWSES